MFNLFYSSISGAGDLSVEKSNSEPEVMPSEGDGCVLSRSIFLLAIESCYSLGASLVLSSGLLDNTSVYFFLQNKIFANSSSMHTNKNAKCMSIWTCKILGLVVDSVRSENHADERILIIK